MPLSFLKDSAEIVCGICRIQSSDICPSFYNVGCSLTFVIFSELIMLIALGIVIYTNTLIPKMDDDLLTAAGKLTHFKKINAEWLKYGILVLVLWLGWLVVELFSGEVTTIGIYAMIVGIILGLTIGMTLGLKVCRNIKKGIDELLGQIKDMQNM